MTAYLPAWTRVLVTACLLAVAFLCYGIGYTAGFQVFFLFGAVFETVFWVRLLHHRPRRQARLEKLRQNA